MILAWGRALLVGSGLDSGKKLGICGRVVSVLLCRERMKSTCSFQKIPSELWPRNQSGPALEVARLNLEEKKATFFSWRGADHSSRVYFCRRGFSPLSLMLCS